MPDNDPRDAQWFLRRMPPPDVLTRVLPQMIRIGGDLLIAWRGERLYATA